MSINSIETVTKYTNALDKLFVQKAATGFLGDNTFGAKFVGAKTVVIPSVEFVGLADYDRDNGFSRGKMTVSQASYTLAKDRARTIQVDRMDMDEVGVVNLAGQVLGEYIRTQVVPECDAYILSKLYGIAKTKSHITTYAAAKAAENLLKVINSVQDASGYDDELVAFVDSEQYGALMTSTEFNRQIVVSDFKQGDLNFKVKTINGVAIIPVTSGRMKSEYTFDAGATATAGGFAAKTDAVQVHAIVLPKKAASVVRKTEKLRIFEPDHNPDADAYKFDYRIVYDALVKNSNLDKIYAIAEAPAEGKI